MRERGSLAYICIYRYTIHMYRRKGKRVGKQVVSWKEAWRGGRETKMMDGHL